MFPKPRYCRTSPATRPIFIQSLQEDLDWAELITVDLSLFGTPEGKKQLANTLIEAVRTKGFFYVKNFNISQERVNKQFAIGREYYELPLEEKSKYTPHGLGKLRRVSSTFPAS
jgi:isopenicillin N synthase-like dioxygenase